MVIWQGKVPDMPGEWRVRRVADDDCTVEICDGIDDWNPNVSSEEVGVVLMTALFHFVDRL